MSYPRYEIFKDTRIEYRFRLKAKNGLIILTASEGYTNKSDCKTAISICQRYSPYDKNYDKRITASSRHYFTLRSDNGKDIGRSEDYNTASARDEGIRDVKRDAPTPTIVDLTLSPIL